MDLTLQSAVSSFGAQAKAKLSNPAIRGEPEDQLRSPLETLLANMAQLCHIRQLAVVGETALADLKTRPDFAVSVRDALVGFIEVKSPGKGADPRRYKSHDKDQWEKLQSLPNLIYTDGNAFSLWRSGELIESIVQLEGNIETAGSALAAPLSLHRLFENFLQWEPIPPRDVQQLAQMTAKLCRLLRDEVTEQLRLKSKPLTALAKDWRKLLFPEATDEKFADGYAQAVTFGLLMARAQGIKLATGLDRVAKKLAQTNSLIGTALRLLTDDVENQETLKTSMGTLVRVLDVVDWPTISRGDPEAWLYFYEDFLAVYDNALRKLTGSYYTPPEVVRAMISLVHEAVQTRFDLHAGLASPTVTLADPAVGTGTFLLGIMRRIAEAVEADEGPGAVPDAIRAAMRRLIAFELQLGPFAVAQLRTLAELVDLIGEAPKTPIRMFVTDTLDNPNAEVEYAPSMLEPIAQSRREANEIKKRERIQVVIGNPPYKEKAKGRGGWVEETLLPTWAPPREWGVGAHAKHLRNLYVYFWRWATWKVFDQDEENNSGMVCFISVAGFLNGPGFERMRDYLRRKTDEIWVIDCSPEGHQPDVPTRVFQGVQQPVCIVLACRSPQANSEQPAVVHYRALPAGDRQKKFEALNKLTLRSKGWIKCSKEWRAPFLPVSTGAWSSYPALENLFVYNGSGVMPGRTWIIAPDAESLRKRWDTLVNSPEDQKKKLFHPHGGDDEKLGDRDAYRIVAKGLPGYPDNPRPVANETGPCLAPIRYGYRSFDRQWIIPDNRLINRPNPELWEAHSKRQVYLTVLNRTSPSSGPAFTFTSSIPDLDHYKGSFGGRAFPLWRDRKATLANVPPILLAHLKSRYHRAVSGEDLIAYVAAIAAHASFTARFQSDLVQPGLRIPLTASAKLFAKAVELGRTVIWLHTYGERFVDAEAGRPHSPPRLPKGESPRIPSVGAIPHDGPLPDEISYDLAKRRLTIGSGYVEPVSPEVWNYEVSGKNVLRQWFSYRKANRERPIIGDRRPPSKLGEIQPKHWPAEYTTELINLLNVLGRLVALEPAQGELLEKVCAGELIGVEELTAAGAISPPSKTLRFQEAPNLPRQGSLLD